MNFLFYIFFFDFYFIYFKIWKRQILHEYAIFNIWHLSFNHLFEIFHFVVNFFFFHYSILFCLFKYVNIMHGNIIKRNKFVNECIHYTQYWRVVDRKKTTTTTKKLIHIALMYNLIVYPWVKQKKNCWFAVEFFII